MRAAVFSLLTVSVLLAPPLTAQAAERTAGFAVSVGMIAPTQYNAPISPFDQGGGLSASIAYGTPAGKRWLAPRVGLSGHSANADASRINVFRLDAGVILGPPRPLGSIAPFLSMDGGFYQADYDRCGVPVLLDGNNLNAASCRGSRTGLGWQAGVGALRRVSRGPAPFGEIRYMQSGRGVDGVVFLVGAMF